MNKNVSLAIKKAVGTIGHKNHIELDNNGPQNQIYSLYQVTQNSFKTREA